MIIEAIDITTITPEPKDIARARNMKMWNTRSHTPCLATSAAKMANLIQDPLKLVRRAKAVVRIWGTRPVTCHDNVYGRTSDECPWRWFKMRLKEMGFTDNQISLIETH
jgi:hypothetical protein